MSNIVITKKRDQYELIAKIVIAAFAIIVAAPFVFSLVKGLVGIAAAVAVAGVVIAIAPAVSLVIANFGVSLLKLEAGRNPVETLQNEYRQKSTLLEQSRVSIETSITKMRTFTDRVKTLKLKYPEEANQFEEQVKSMETLLSLRKEKYKTAKSQLQEFSSLVEKADAIWQATQALAEATDGKDVVAEFYSDLRTKTALDSVQESLNHSFAALDTSLLDAAAEKNLLA